MRVYEKVYRQRCSNESLREGLPSILIARSLIDPFLRDDRCRRFDWGIPNRSPLPFLPRTLSYDSSASDEREGRGREGIA